MTDPLRWALRIVAYLLLQLLLFQHLVLWDVAVPHLYVLPLLLMPLDFSKPWLFFLAFGSGLIVDQFTGLLGPHASAALAAVGLREAWLGVYAPQMLLGDRDDAPLLQQPLPWLGGYLPVVLLVFELWYFTVADWDFGWHTLLKAAASGTYSYLLSLLFLILFHRQAGGR